MMLPRSKPKQMRNTIECTERCERIDVPPIVWKLRNLTRVVVKRNAKQNEFHRMIQNRHPFRQLSEAYRIVDGFDFEFDADAENLRTGEPIGLCESVVQRAVPYD